MKKFFLLFLITLTFVSFSQIPETVKRNLLNGKSPINSMGRFFVVAAPPNEDDETNIRRQTLEMYVACDEPSILTIENPITGASQQVACEPGTITTINGENGGFSWDYEIRETESVRPIPKALVLYATRPVSVYVMNSKGFSTDGYLAIPVAYWGKEYTHLSFWDQYENGSRATGGGFVVLAAENETTVDIHLGGRGSTEETHSGKRVGDEFTETLDLGEALMILGDGTTRGRLDLSGSKIKADKPIGLLSFQQRCLIPVLNCTNGRDHLISMIPPEQAWGKTYVTIETARGTGMGDYFRVVAKEPNTTIQCNWFDLATGAVIGSYTFFIEDPMDFQEYSQQLTQSPESTPSIRGVSVFTSNKPFHVNQYSYSANWDQQNDYDPFMVPVTHTDNYTNYTIFQTPSNDNPGNDYADNYLNLIMKGHPDPSINAQLLSTIKMDGEPIANKYPQILGGNKIPGTDLVFLTITEVPQGAHTLEGETEFGGYVYGFATFDSYAWPAAMAGKNNTVIDSIGPRIQAQNDCGTFELLATELVDFEPANNCGENGDEPCPPQIDSHFDIEPLEIENMDSNFEYSLNWESKDFHDDRWFAKSGGEDQLYYTWEVVDNSQDAKVVYAVVDKSGNVTLDTLEYFADKYTLSEERNFEVINLDKSKSFLVNYKSESGSTMSLYEPILESLASESVFTLTLDENIEWPIILQPNEEISFEIKYSPTIEYLDAKIYNENGDLFKDIRLPKAEVKDQNEAWANAWDVAKINIETGCRSDEIYFYGRGGLNYFSTEAVEISIQRENENDIPIRFEINNFNTELSRAASAPLRILGFDLENITSNSEEDFTNRFEFSGLLDLDDNNNLLESIFVSRGSTSNFYSKTLDGIRLKVVDDLGDTLQDGQYQITIPVITDLVNQEERNIETNLTLSIDVVTSVSDRYVTLDNNVFNIERADQNTIRIFSENNINGPINYQLYDLNGNKIRNESIFNSNRFEKYIDINSLAIGSYYINLEFNGKSGQLRFVK